MIEINITSAQDMRQVDGSQLDKCQIMVTKADKYRLTWSLTCTCKSKMIRKQVFFMNSSSINC